MAAIYLSKIQDHLTKGHQQSNAEINRKGNFVCLYMLFVRSNNHLSSKEDSGLHASPEKQRKVDDTQSSICMGNG